MGQSLQEQLLNSGLASKKQARKAQQSKTRSKKKKKAGHQVPDEQAEVSREAAAADAARRRRDRERAQKANAEREARERRAAADQLIAQSAQKRDKVPEDEPAYSYTLGGRIRQLAVSRQERLRIADGKLGIVRRNGRTVLVERRVAERLLEMVPANVCLITPDDKAAADPDDPYAGYEVPDDLMW